VPNRLDFYTLRLFAGPFALALGILLLAQLLERLLRLFDLAASAGAPLSTVLLMAANLVPHYLGLAVPMAFTAAIFMAVARMGDDNELDVMLATGRSITRIALPFFGVAIVLSLVNLYLFGTLQPMSRYGYHLAMDAALHTGWGAKIEDRRFIDTGKGLVFTATSVDADGRGLQGIFVEHIDAGREEITTAPRGRLVPSDDGQRLLLSLEQGLVVRDEGEQRVSTLSFQRALIDEDFTPAAPPFRARGESVRERTSAELRQDMASTGVRGEPAAEFHGRLARALMLPLLPLFALPLGMASKRGRRAPGVVFASLALLALNHAMQFGESLAESGRADALPAVWTPLLVFGGLGVWLFRSSLAWPGDNPVTRALTAIEAGFEGVLGGLRPRLRRRRPT